MLTIEGREVMVEKLQADLTQTGFDHVGVSLEFGTDLVFTHSNFGRFGDEARRAVWKASALLFPLTHVCWACFESNAGVGIHQHCNLCSCCN